MTTAVLWLCGRLARYGHVTLVAGLLAGLGLPGVAAALKPWLPQLVMLLLFLVALRIGPRQARAGMADLPATLVIVVVLQLGLPLVVIAVAALLGLGQSAYVMAAVLVCAAPALSGSPSLAIILGADPEPAFRMLIVGTFLLPLTVLPVFWLLPQFGDFRVAAATAQTTCVVIVIAMGAGFVVRGLVMPQPSRAQSEALDGVMTLAMAVIVVGLMAALRPALSVSVPAVAGWLVLACALNLGLQVLGCLVWRRVLPARDIVPVSIVSGNRNIAIFLVALSPATAEPLLIFLACYQVPMYLTPLLMRRFYSAVTC